MPIKIPPPDLQISFVDALQTIREKYLQEALGKAVTVCDLASIDNDLQAYAPKTDVAKIARLGLRGELVFATPTILETEPQLLAYYRLLLGHSRKAFYDNETGLSSFKGMEEKNKLSATVHNQLPELCTNLNYCASLLLNGIGIKQISMSLLYDLTLLTLGPQLRGGANVRKGNDAIIEVFNAIKAIVEDHADKIEKNRILLTNAAGRPVYIEFSSDPDIVIREDMGKKLRNIIAVEVKGGRDFSNIHNRIGEAEKSHQKARQDDFVECWTVVNVDKMDIEMAKKESPSTNRFYRISQLTLANGNEYEDFRSRIISLTGIPSIN